MVPNRSLDAIGVIFIVIFISMCPMIVDFGSNDFSLHAGLLGNLRSRDLILPSDWLQGIDKCHLLS